VEQLEERRLLALTCSFNSMTGEYDIRGNNSVNDIINVFWDSGTAEVYVKENTTEVCRQSGVTLFKIYGGASPSATSTGDDTITIDSGMDATYDSTIFGQDGNDSLTGAGANDSLVGGDGADSLYGNDNDDTLEGGAGNDYANGGGGNDTVYGNGDADDLWGGVGSDRLEGGDNNDTMNGDADQDTLLGQGGNDSMLGGSHNDTLIGGTGADVYSGGNGNDTADYSAETANQTISMDNSANDGALLEGDNVNSDMETVLTVGQ
jgi:Ca2+-binding RTX toxin-like protein